MDSVKSVSVKAKFKDSNKLGKREITRQRNRQSILDAARDCFAERGFDQVTVRDIISRTNLASGTFYNYFTDKESIFRAILDDYMARLNAKLHQLRRNASNLEEFIYTTYLALFQAIAEDPVIYRLAHENHRAIRDIYDANLLGQTVSALEQDIKTSIQRGILPAIEENYLISAFFGVGYELGLCVAQSEPVNPEAAARFATGLFVGGINEIAARQSIA